MEQNLSTTAEIACTIDRTPSQRAAKAYACLERLTERAVVLKSSDECKLAASRLVCCPTTRKPPLHREGAPLPWRRRVVTTSLTTTRNGSQKNRHLGKDSVIWLDDGQIIASDKARDKRLLDDQETLKTRLSI